MTTKEETSRRLLNSAILVIGATLLSRILGVGREIVFANQFGTTEEYGAYKAAFRIPDTLYLLIIGGALGSSLIPVFSRFLGQNEDAKAWKLANTVVNYTMVVLVITAALTWLLAPFIVANLLAPGFSPALQALTTDLTRLLLLQPFFLGLGGIALALLNGSERFLWPALAPLIYNVSIIAGAIFLVKPLGIYGVVVGVLIGAVLYFLVQLPVLIRLGFYYKPSLNRDTPGASQVLRALGPRLLGQAAFQANFFVVTNLGSGLANGASRVAAFEYAYQIFMLPHGVFAVSLATVAFPAMSRLLGSGDSDAMKRTLVSTIRQIVFFALPASIGIGLLARPIVKSLFESGEFGPNSTALVAQALLWFSFGLVAYGVAEILTRAFYALQDTWTPVTIALITIGLNVGLSLILIQPLQQGGLTLALAITTTIEMVLLIVLLRHKFGAFSPNSQADLIVPLGKIVLASVAMGIVLFGALQVLGDMFATQTKFVTLLLTGLLIGIGGLTFAVAAYWLGIEELKSAIRRFVKRG